MHDTLSRAPKDDQTLEIYTSCGANTSSSLRPFADRLRKKHGLRVSVSNDVLPF